MMHFNFKVDGSGAWCIIDACLRQAMRSLQKSLDTSKTEGERKYYRHLWERELELVKKLEYTDRYVDE